MPARPTRGAQLGGRHARSRRCDGVGRTCGEANDERMTRRAKRGILSRLRAGRLANAPIAARFALARLRQCGMQQVPATGMRRRPKRTHGLDPHPRRAHAQPQERQSRPAAQPAGRDHRTVRLGQVLARVRHALRRGPAPLRRVAVGLRAPVPAAHGEAGRRPDRRPVAGDLDRAEGDDATTRARRSARSPRSTTTCGCCTRASATRTAPTTGADSSRRRASRRWSTRRSRCPRTRGS